MTKEYPETFSTWRRVKCGEVKNIPIDTLKGDYKSKYIIKYNHLRDRGWERKDNYWVSPRRPEGKYKNIEEAYSSQMYYEEISKKV